MTFKINDFSYDDAQKRATVMLSEDSIYINCNFALEVQEDESIEGIKRKAILALQEMVERALKDALDSIPAPHVA